MLWYIGRDLDSLVCDAVHMGVDCTCGIPGTVLVGNLKSVRV